MEETNYVYILRSGNTNNFKIGVSKNIENRIKQLQTGNPYKITVYHYFEAPTRENAFNCEHWLHKFFDGHKTELMRGEWYRITLKELEPFLKIDYTTEAMCYCVENWKNRPEPYTKKKKKTDCLKDW